MYISEGRNYILATLAIIYQLGSQLYITYPRNCTSATRAVVHLILVLIPSLGGLTKRPVIADLTLVIADLIRNLLEEERSPSLRG